MKCSKCAYCIRSYKDSYCIDCVKFGNNTREVNYCIHYITRDDFAKQEIKKLEDKAKL